MPSSFLVALVIIIHAHQSVFGQSLGEGYSCEFHSQCNPPLVCDPGTATCITNTKSCSTSRQCSPFEICENLLCVPDNAGCSPECNAYQLCSSVGCVDFFPRHCEYGWRLFGDSCYQMLREPDNFYGSRRSCKMNEALLASISSDAEMHFINETVVNSDKQMFWIGVEKKNNEWFWPDGTSLQTEKYWRGREPDGCCGRTVKCAIGNYVSTDGKWDDTSCWYSKLRSRPIEAVCKKPKIRAATGAGTPAPVSSPCPNGWTRNAPYCYQVFTNGSSVFHENEAECWKFDAHLVSIQSNVERQFVNNLVLAAGGRRYWIGLEKDKDGVWKWTDGTSLVYGAAPRQTPWRGWEPDNCCAYGHAKCAFANYVGTSGNWDDTECDTPTIQFSYVCKKNEAL